MTYYIILLFKGRVVSILSYEEEATQKEYAQRFKDAEYKNISEGFGWQEYDDVQTRNEL